jgi:hypothetical protein
MALTDSDAIDRLSNAFNTFVTASDTTSPTAWDTAYESFINETESLLKLAASGHPSGFPKRRPN